MSGLKEVVILKGSGIPGIYRVVFRIKSFNRAEARKEAEIILETMTPAQKNNARIEDWPVPGVIDTFGYEIARVIDLIRPERNR